MLSNKFIKKLIEIILLKHSRIEILKLKSKIGVNTKVRFDEHMADLSHL